MPKNKEEMKDLLLWNKISRIVMLLAECLDISPVRALDIFYNRENCQFLYNSSFGFYLTSYVYILDDIIRELLTKGY